HRAVSDRERKSRVARCCCPGPAHTYTAAILHRNPPRSRSASSACSRGSPGGSRGNAFGRCCQGPFPQRSDRTASCRRIDTLLSGTARDASASIAVSHRSLPDTFGGRVQSPAPASLNVFSLLPLPPRPPVYQTRFARQHHRAQPLKTRIPLLAGRNAVGRMTIYFRFLKKEMKGT